MSNNVVRLAQRSFSEREENAIRHALDWVYRFGLSERGILEHTLFPEIRDGLVRDMLARGWLRELETGEADPRKILVLADDGYGEVGENYPFPLPCPEMTMRSWNGSGLHKRLHLQIATADNLRGGLFEGFRTPRMPGFGDIGDAGMDLEWLLPDGLVYAVEVDLDGRSGGELERFAARVIDRAERGKYHRTVIILGCLATLERYREIFRKGARVSVWEGEGENPSRTGFRIMPDLNERVIFMMMENTRGPLRWR